MTIKAREVLAPSWTRCCRVEPTARFSWDDDPQRAAAALAAELHDPLWTLHRQWQMGEFKGEDAAAPCGVELIRQELPLARWWPGTAPGTVAQSRSLSASGGVVEAATTGEPLPLDTRAAVELGRLLLGTIQHCSYAASLTEPRRASFMREITAWLVRRSPLAEAASDDASTRLVRRTRATVPDGGALLKDSRLGGDLDEAWPDVPAYTGGDSWQDEVLGAWEGAARRLLGLGAGGLYSPTDPARPASSPSWDVSRLDHRLVVATEGASGSRVVLRVDPDADGALDWYAFELLDNPESAWSGARTVTHRGIPGRVTLAGGPSPRWWDLEDSARSLVALDLDVGTSEQDALNHSSARFAWLDFQLVHGQDWFMLAVPATVGSLCRIDRLVVKDVFGFAHKILPAEPGAGARRWSMFRSGASSGDRRVLVVAPTTASLHDPGAPIEQIRFARDEQANLVWAISQILPDALSRGRRVDRAALERPDERGVFRSDQQPPRLRYVPQTSVPRGWLPFVPMLIKPGSEQIRLQRAAVAGADGRRYSASPSPLLATAPGVPLYLREESIPRGGVRVQRRPVRARDVNGEVVVWVHRGAEVGMGEAQSGLRFDLAVNDDGQAG